MKSLLVVCMVLVKNQKVLLFRKGPNSSSPGKWELPGGKVLPDETEFEALEREVQEELQWKVIPIRRGSVTSQGENIELIPIEVSVSNYDFTLSEHDEFKWVSFEDLKRMEVSFLDIPILKSYLK